MQKIIDFYSIFPEESKVNYWVKKIEEDPIVLKIISSNAFLRLNDISFLGSLDYTSFRLKNKKIERNRAYHSLHVAALAKYVAVKRNYSKELTDHLVAAALLHDIGHPPFSHSAEPSIKKQLGYGHHEMGELIIRGKERTIGTPLNNILAKHLDVEFIIDLLNKEVDANSGGDLFSSEINIDTIDGIIRSLSYHTQIEPTATIEIAEASFLQDLSSKESRNILDSFWMKKNFVYNKIINSHRGVLQDKICELYFVHEEKFPESYFIKRESSLKTRFQSLFQALKSSHKSSNYPSWIEGESINYTHREYTIDCNEHGLKRYKTKKVKIKLDTKINNDRPYTPKISSHQQWDLLFQSDH
jgi:HD superfamily phosphohydrolase